MDSLITFWKWIYLIGLGGFAVMAIAIAPLGARDLIRLFKSLRETGESGEDVE